MENFLQKIKDNQPLVSLIITIVTIVCSLTFSYGQITTRMANIEQAQSAAISRTGSLTEEIVNLRIAVSELRAEVRMLREK